MNPLYFFKNELWWINENSLYEHIVPREVLCVYVTDEGEIHVSDQIDMTLMEKPWIIL